MLLQIRVCLIQGDPCSARGMLLQRVTPARVTAQTQHQIHSSLHFTPAKPDVMTRNMHKLKSTTILEL